MHAYFVRMPDDGDFKVIIGQILLFKNYGTQN